MTTTFVTKNTSTQLIPPKFSGLFFLVRVFPVTGKTSNTFRIFNSVFIVAIFPSCPLFYPVQCCNADSVEEWIFIQQIVDK